MSSTLTFPPASRISRLLTAAILALLVGAALLHGPIEQPADYHDFADRHALWGIPHAQDVLSNLPFALVALWGWWRLAIRRRAGGRSAAWPGYRLFLVGLFLTALGSAFYHWAPDNARLVWDRLPIALACAGLLAGAWSDTHRRNGADAAACLALVAVLSVAWWYFGQLAGRGDLRPYLILQATPILLIPLWQFVHRAPREERRKFSGALLLYVVAKVAELNDHVLLAATGVIGGHTLKHLLAAAAAGMIVHALVRRAGCDGADTSRRSGQA